MFREHVLVIAFDHISALKPRRKPIFSVFLSDSEHEKSEITFGDIKEAWR
jgi:hypothetical protein